MANSSAISRGSLIVGLCLPLAVLLGYMLAEPLDAASLAVVLVIFCVLSIPLLMRWHHPLLVLSWNAAISPYFLPGQPSAWMLMSVVSCLFAVITRAVDSKRRFLLVPAMTKALAAVVILLVITALMTGGAGLRSMGSEQFGGKYYLYILLAVIGYFALTSQPIPREQAGWYVAFFFLSGMTALVSNLAYMGGPGFYFLYQLFPPDIAMAQAQGEASVLPGAIRISGLVQLALAVWSFLLARFGLLGVFDFGRPWRMALLVATFGAGLLGGFRSVFIYLCLVAMIMFCLERLWRTRVAFLLLIGGVLMLAGLILFAERLPLSAQRAVSFLPIKVDPIARMDAEVSTQWRVEMWKKLLPDVPHYLLKGKGYALNPSDLYLIQESVTRGFANSSDIAALAGDYHNGMLSLLIPFGIWGVLVFGWLFWVAGKILHANYRYGAPEIKRINTLLFALFLTRLIIFFVIFGSIYGDLYYFLGLVGFSVSLNGGVRTPVRLSPGEPATG